MPNNTRNTIKWLPFNSVISSKKIIADIVKEKNKISMPILSNDQKKAIENTIIESYFEHNKIKINYFYNGYIYTIYDYIKKIDFTNHKIHFSNKIIIFEQIISI